MVTLTVSVGLVSILSRYLRRRKRARLPQSFRIDTAVLHRRLKSGLRSPNGGASNLINLYFI